MADAPSWRFLQPTVRAVVVLGGFGWTALWPVLRAAGEQVPAPRAERSATAPRSRCRAGPTVLGCYHVSQQNTFTGRLTEPMLDDVLARAKALAGCDPDMLVPRDSERGPVPPPCTRMR